MRYTGAAMRRAELLRLLGAEGYLGSAESAKRLGVSEMTIRRDFQRFEERDIARRVAGGATIDSRVGLPFERRDAADAEYKRAIAARAASAIRGATTVSLDAGTTVAALIPHVRAATIVTHSLPVIVALAGSHPQALVACGGRYQPDTRSFAGLLTVDTLRSIRCDVAVVSATAVTPEGLWGTNALDAQTKRAMIGSAGRVIVLADASKLGRTAPVRIVDTVSIDVLITDRRVEPAILASMRQAGVDVFVTS